MCVIWLTRLALLDLVIYVPDVVDEVLVAMDRLSSSRLLSRSTGTSAAVTAGAHRGSSLLCKCGSCPDLGAALPCCSVRLSAGRSLTSPYDDIAVVQRTGGWTIGTDTASAVRKATFVNAGVSGEDWGSNLLTILSRWQPETPRQ